MLAICWQQDKLLNEKTEREDKEPYNAECNGAEVKHGWTYLSNERQMATHGEER